MKVRCLSAKIFSVKVLVLGAFNKDKEPSLKIVNIDC